MKTDNRPVKLECFLKTRKSELSPRRSIGTLLLPIRGVQVLSSLSNVTVSYFFRKHYWHKLNNGELLKFKLHWHKLGALGSEWRANKPEIYLMLIILKKSILESGQLESFMGRVCKMTLPFFKCKIEDNLMWALNLFYVIYLA